MSDQDRGAELRLQETRKHWYETRPPEASAAADRLEAATASEAAAVEQAHEDTRTFDAALMGYSHRAQRTRTVALAAADRLRSACAATDPLLRDLQFSVVLTALEELNVMHLTGECRGPCCVPTPRMLGGDLVKALHTARASVRSSRPRVGPRLQVVDPDDAA